MLWLTQHRPCPAGRMPTDPRSCDLPGSCVQAPRSRPQGTASQGAGARAAGSGQGLAWGCAMQGCRWLTLVCAAEAGGQRLGACQGGGGERVHATGQRVQQEISLLQPVAPAQARLRLGSGSCPKAASSAAAGSPDAASFHLRKPISSLLVPLDSPKTPPLSPNSWCSLRRPRRGSYPSRGAAAPLSWNSEPRAKPRGLDRVVGREWGQGPKRAVHTSQQPGALIFQENKAMEGDSPLPPPVQSRQPH